MVKGNFRGTMREKEEADKENQSLSKETKKAFLHTLLSACAFVLEGRLMISCVCITAHNNVCT